MILFYVLNVFPDSDPDTNSEESESEECKHFLHSTIKELGYTGEASLLMSKFFGTI